MRQRYYGYNRSDYYYPRTSREAFGSDMDKPSGFEPSRVMLWLGWALAVFLFFVLIGRYA